nr:hypothetical protein [Sicyoidochytrium minutum DNA virus]
MVAPQFKHSGKGSLNRKSFYTPRPYRSRTQGYKTPVKKNSYYSSAFARQKGYTDALLDPRPGFPPRHFSVFGEGVAPNTYISKGDAYNDWSSGISTGIAYNGEVPKPQRPEDVSIGAVYTGLTRLRTALAFMTPFNVIMVILILVLWIWLYAKDAVNDGLGEFDPGNEASAGTFDGQRRNDFTTLNANIGEMQRNFRGTSLLCEVTGFGCTTNVSGVTTLAVKKPFFVYPINKGGFNIIPYKKDATAPRTSFQEAVTRDGCAGLTLEEAEEYLCDRNIINSYWFKRAAYTNDFCTTEVNMNLCGQWRACLNRIAATHFKTTEKPSALSGRPKVAPSAWLDFPDYDVCDP